MSIQPPRLRLACCEHVWPVSSLPGERPQANPYSESRVAFRREPRKWLVLLSWKAQRGLLAGPENFKVKPAHLVSVLIDQRHIILPVQGLICPLNQHLLSSAAVICWKAGKKEPLQLNHSKQVWVRANFLLPFVMSSHRHCVLKTCFITHIGILQSFAMWGVNVSKQIRNKVSSYFENVSAFCKKWSIFPGAEDAICYTRPFVNEKIVLLPWQNNINIQKSNIQ